MNNEKPSVGIDADLNEIILEMTSKRLGATAVLNKKGALCGIITDGDLRRMLRAKRDMDVITALDIMTENPITIKAHQLAVEAKEVFQQKNITQILVVDSAHQYVGMIHFHDLIREGLV